MTATESLSPFDAFIFDMDGILTDTEVIWDEIRRGLAREDGCDWPDDATTAMMGMSTPEWAAFMSQTVGLRGDADDAARRVISAMQERYHRHLPLLPGAVEAIRRMAQLHPLGLASSSPRILIDAALATMGVTDIFAATVSTEEVARGKPAPDGYQRVCQLLGVNPSRAVCVEDSSNGVRSAAAAGMTVIAIPQQFHPLDPDADASAAVILGSLHELTAPVLQAAYPSSPASPSSAAP